MDATEQLERPHRLRPRDRLLLAMFLAPPAGGAATGATIILALFVFMSASATAPTMGWSGVAEIARIIALGAIFGALYGYPVILIVGLPLYFLVRQLKIRSLFAWILLGLLAGGLSASSFLLWVESGRLRDAVTAPADTVRWLAGAVAIPGTFASLCGAVAGLVCWLIVRPDRSSDFRPRPRLEAGEQHRV